MGRVDEALKRVDLDVSRGTQASTAGASPWQFDAHDPGHVDAPGRPAEVPAGFRAADNPALVLATDALPLNVEQFRCLAATLLQAQLQQSIKSVLVTSASPGDGKSHVALNLALTLAESYGRRVILVDADLRRPSLHNVLRVPGTGGLGEALHAAGPNRVATIPITPRLKLLPAGVANSNPLQGLSSDRMKRIVADAAAEFEWVIVDAPPVGVLADARLVSEMVDGVLLVVRANVTQFPDLQAASETIGRERILGLVMNAVNPLDIASRDYYYHYYSQDAPPDR
jgi:capsular exopolysaccharide synthesis family protein